MKRFAEAKNEVILVIPVIVKPTIVVVEPRLGVVTVHIEQVRVTITVAMYTIPSMTPSSVKTCVDLLD
jgi:hypothetical protein